MGEYVSVDRLVHVLALLVESKYIWESLFFPVVYCRFDGALTVVRFHLNCYVALLSVDISFIRIALYYWPQDAP